MRVGDDTRWGGMMVRAPLDHAVSSEQAGRGDDGRSATNVGVHTDATTDHKVANLPRWSGAMTASTGGTGGKSGVTNSPSTGIQVAGREFALLRTPFLRLPYALPSGGSHL